MTPGVACVMWGDVGDGFSSALLIVASHERQWTFSHQPLKAPSTGAQLEKQRLMKQKTAKATLAKTKE